MPDRFQSLQFPPLWAVEASVMQYRLQCRISCLSKFAIARFHLCPIAHMVSQLVPANEDHATCGSELMSEM